MKLMTQMNVLESMYHDDIFIFNILQVLSYIAVNNFQNRLHVLPLAVVL